MLLCNFDPKYWPQSPEMSIQNAIHNRRPLSEAIRLTIQQKSTFRMMESILGVSSTAAEAELRRFWVEQEEYSGREGASWVPFFKAYWRTWDSWSVGAVFIRILQKCFLQKSFVEGVWKKHAISIRHVLKGLLETDPRKRLLPAQALALLKASAGYSSTST